MEPINLLINSWLISIRSAEHQWLIRMSAPLRIHSVPSQGAAGVGNQERDFGSTSRWGKQEARSLPNQLKKWWKIAIKKNLLRTRICNQLLYFCSSTECWCNCSNPVTGLQLKTSRESAKQGSPVPYTHLLKNQTALYHVSSDTRTFYILSWQCKLKHAAVMAALICQTCLSSAVHTSIYSVSIHRVDKRKL